MSEQVVAQQDLSGAKKAMRTELRRALADLDTSQARIWSQEACRRLIESDLFENARTLMTYLPMPGELDIWPILEATLESGRTLCLPRIGWEDKTLTPIAVQGLDDEQFTTTRHGVREPAGNQARQIQIPQLELVIVPGLGFDCRCSRIGRGAGFYDRFLSRPELAAPLVGLAFECQVVDSVPTDEHDVCLNAVVTQDRIIRA